MTAPETITLEDIERIEQNSQWDGVILALCAAARRGVEASVCPDCHNTFQQPFKCATCGAQKLYDAALLAAQQRAEKAQAANVKLVGAIDMIRETLNGGNVQDLLLIINNALDEARNV